MARHTMKSARVFANLSQGDVAAKLSISRITLSNWEQGYTYPNIIQFKRLCQLYGVSMDDIFLPDE